MFLSLISLHYELYEAILNLQIKFWFNTAVELDKLETR